MSIIEREDYYSNVQKELRLNPKKWLITGVAGFIGSNLLEFLLNLGQEVVGLDNYATGFEGNLKEVENKVGKERWRNFRFINGDIVQIETCFEAVRGADVVLHQAALGSVPRSIKNPIDTNLSNVNGFLNILVAMKELNVSRIVFAGSSSTYGDHPRLPKEEDIIGNPLSPYAVTKYVNELYADVFSKTYELEYVGLRYFNVFGKRQNPNGAYSAVIPRWAYAISNNHPVYIYGDGSTSRDFCYVDNVVQANILAATTTNSESINKIYNIAVGDRTTLIELYQMLMKALSKFKTFAPLDPIFEDFRAGDVKHSQADISRAIALLNYSPKYTVEEGIEKDISWYI